MSAREISGWISNPKYSKELKWLAKHFKPDQCFILNDKWYGIIKQTTDNYAIKCVSLNDFDYAPDSGRWIKWPENRYETLGGAYYAILLNHQTMER